jgi:prepilin-type N-terminal cleavage/methylation domain-containing protein
MLSRRDSTDNGFTLVELIFVMAVLGIFALIAVVAYGAATNSAGTAVCRANQRILEGAIVSYQAGNDGERPDSLTDLDDFVGGSDYHLCPTDSSVPLGYDKGTGDVSCTLHP